MLEVYSFVVKNAHFYSNTGLAVNKMILVVYQSIHIIGTGNYDSHVLVFS